MTEAQTPQPEPSHDIHNDEFAHLRPNRWKARLLFWLMFSVVLHGVGALVVWRSQTVRDWLFSSFRDKPAQMEDLQQLSTARKVYDQLVRKRIVEVQKKMLQTSKLVQEKRAKEWDGVRERALVNPHFKAMLDGGLPPFDMVDTPGNPREGDILNQYDLSKRIEEQVFSLYEQFKSVNLSLSTIKNVKDGQAVPQALSDSLSLNRLERPPRYELKKELLQASDQELFAIKAVAAVKPSESSSGSPEQPDGFRRWRAEATIALEQCEIMANNCQRIMTNVVGGGPGPDTGISSLPAALGGGPAWSDGKEYTGESLQPQDAGSSDLSSFDPNATVTLGKGLGAEETSKQAKYLAIDTWWSIGPFEHVGGVRNETSINHKYPPENGVDLDATYIGKKGEKIRWNYHPMSSVKQVPRPTILNPSQHNCIWYFYTEFWSDTDQKVRVDIASDDFGALWLNPSPQNPDPVYTSGIEPRPWVILDFKQNRVLNVRKGTNRILMKLDNRGGLTGFTVTFMLKSKTPTK